MADQAVLDELLKMQSAREADMMAKTTKVKRVMWIGSLVAFASFYVPVGPLRGLAAIWLLLAFAVLTGVALGTFIRQSETKKFRKLLAERPEQVTQVHAQINVAYGVKSGTALHISTMDGGRGSAPFLDADVEPATALLRQLCPNLR